MSESMKEPFLDLRGGENPSSDELDSQVQRAQEQLLQLKRQQEAIEKQKRELEELSRKQDELEKGRAEMVEKLSRSLVVIERQTYEAETRVEQLKTSAVAFSQHLRALERIDPKAWANDDLHKELSKALSSVDDARAEYSKSITKINAGSADDVIDPHASNEYSEYFAGEEGNFAAWFKRGLAFTLPLILFGLIGIILFIVFHFVLSK
jgi:predicted RNase H-like nuclease (RuvC/YqgF family)